MSALGSLVVKLALQYTEYKGGLDKSEQDTLQAAKRMQDQMDRAGEAVSGGIDRLKAAAVGLASGMAAAFSVSAVAAGVKQQVEYAATLGRTAESIGVTTNALSEMHHVAELAGVQYDTLNDGLKDLNKAMAESAAGDKNKTAAFKALGVSVLDAAGGMRSADAVMADVAQRFNGMEDGALKVKLAEELMGDAGVRLIPMLNAGAGAMAEAREQAVALGLSVGPEFAAQSAMMEERLTVLEGKMRGVFTHGAVELLPLMLALTGSMEDQAKSGQKLSGLWEALAVPVEAAVVFFANLHYVLSAIGNDIGAMAAQIDAAIHLDFDRFAEIHKMAVQDAEAARAEIDRYSESILKARDRAREFNAMAVSAPSNAKLASLRARVADPAETDGATAALKRYQDQLNATSKTAVTETQKMAQRGMELAASLTAQASGLSGDFGKKWDDLSAAYGTGAINLDQLVRAQAELLKQQPFMVNQAKDLKEAQDKASESVAKWADQRLSETKALTDQIQTRQDEIAGLGLSAEASAQLSAAKLEQAAAEKEAYAAALQAASFYAGEYQDAYRQAAADALEQAAALRQLAGLELEKGTRQAAVEARDEWKKSVEKIDDIFRQGFADMINSGKSGWDSFTKSLTTTFKTAVADQIYKMLAQPFVVRLVVAITGVGGASAAGATGLTGSGGGSGSLGQAYNAYSTYSSLTSGAKWFTDFGGSVTNLINQAGGKLFNAGLEQVGETLMNFSNTYASQITQFSNVAGNALGYLSAAYDLSQGKYGSTIGTAVGTYFGGPIGGAIGNALGSVVDGIFGWGDKETTYKLTTNSSQAPTKKVFEDGVYVQSVYGNIGMADHYSNGIKADKYKDTFQSIANLDAGIAAGLTAAQNAAIKKALDGYTGGKNGTVEAYVQGRLQIITNTLGGAIDALADQFKGTTEQFAGYVTQLVQVQALIPSITFLNKALDGTSTAATQTAMALSTAFGGVSGANSVLGSFVQNYYTDAEKLTMQTASLAEVFQAAGLTMPHTTQEFRSLVEAQDLTTDAGRKSYVALMAVSGAFYDLTQQAKSAAGALGADFFSTAADYQYYQTTGQVPARVPAFAAGGMHGGGWAVVGEQGPELVNLSPARVYSNSDSKGLLDTSGLARELAALRADARINAATLVDVLKRVDKLFNRWDMNGMPETRSVAV